MFRQSFARVHSSFGQQRKLFLLVFLWTCLCLVILKSNLFNGASSNRLPAEPVGSLEQPTTGKLHERSAGLQQKQQVRETLRAPPSSPTVSHSTRAHNPAAAAESGPAVAVAVAGSIPGSQCKYKYPSLFDLQFNNIHWQKFVMKASFTRPLHANESNESTSANNRSPSWKAEPDVTYYLYNAYYDDRWRAGLPSVRILAMIDRIEPPATNCLLWSNKLRAGRQEARESANSPGAPIVTRASFVYAWYPKWGNYKDGLLQPWIVTCPLPRAHVGLVPDSVSLVPVPRRLPARSSETATAEESPLEPQDQAAAAYLVDPAARRRRNAQELEQLPSMAMPPSFSSSSPPSGLPAALHNKPTTNAQASLPAPAASPQADQFDCQALQAEPISNNLPVFNQRPSKRGKFAVCVKGLDFPHEDVSVRLVEWIELLNLLGAGKIFLYELDVHENISKVLHYYQKRGIVELSPLTLPGEQPNLPDIQHAYLKSKLTVKRQNELIPYNDCLYRNLNSFQYLALLDIDEIIMPMRPDHHNWFDLMAQVEEESLREQNYSRASYNVRNVYFFDDLAGPAGTSSPVVEERGLESNLEQGIPHYLHMMQHVYRSRNYTKPGQYVKCFHNTDRVVSLHNHFPMNCFGQCTTYSIPVQLAHLQHYRKDCVGPLKQSCKNDYRAFTQRDTTIWKYKQQMIRRTTRVLNHLGLLNNNSKNSNLNPAYQLPEGEVRTE